MKLASFHDGTRRRVGAVLGDELVDLAAASAAAGGTGGDALAHGDMAELLAAGAPALDDARRAVDHVGGLAPDAPERAPLVRDLRTTRLLPPVPRPPKVICVARNYAEHAKEVGFELPTIPILFARFPVTLVASGDPIVRPTVSEQLDWEGELAVVIGRGGRHITREAAFDHVAGYAIFNDVTVRDYQFRVPQYTAGKNFSSSGPFGPWLTLADEVPDPRALELTTHINDVEKQRASMGDMIFDIPTLIEHIAEFIELEPGDVIATGSPAGVGFKREPPEFLRPGDVCRVAITGLGVLENPVTAETEQPA